MKVHFRIVNLNKIKQVSSFQLNSLVSFKILQAMLLGSLSNLTGRVVRSVSFSRNRATRYISRYFSYTHFLVHPTEHNLVKRVMLPAKHTFNMVST